MRISCLLCVCKHLGSAAVLYAEYRNGYTQYFAYILGELEQAWQESAKDYEEFSAMIYAEKKNFESNPSGYVLQVATLAEEASTILDKELSDAGA